MSFSHRPSFRVIVSSQVRAWGEIHSSASSVLDNSTLAHKLKSRVLSATLLDRCPSVCLTACVRVVWVALQFVACGKKFKEHCSLHLCLLPGAFPTNNPPTHKTPRYRRRRRRRRRLLLSTGRVSTAHTKRSTRRIKSGPETEEEGAGKSGLGEEDERLPSIFAGLEQGKTKEQLYSTTVQVWKDNLDFTTVNSNPQPLMCRGGYGGVMGLPSAPSQAGGLAQNQDTLACS